jgi:hypothetical protein
MPLPTENVGSRLRPARPQAAIQDYDARFTEGGLAGKNDPRNPWTGRSLREQFIELNHRFSPIERENIGIHTCPGIDPINPRVETPEEVSADLVLASQHIPLERLGSTEGCGFSPFRIDAKPRHGFSDAARDIAFEKITARVTGTKMASARLAL